MKRRTFVGAIGGGTLAGVAGCLTRDESGSPNSGDDLSGSPKSGTITVATYDSMIDGTDPAGTWLKEAFEEAYPDATLEWTTAENGLNHYIQREAQDASLEADVYLGVNVDDLARIDDELGDGGLFLELADDRLDRTDRIRDGLAMGDPHGRVRPFDTGYISLVYDETVVDAPETFDDLLDPAYEGTLLAQNAQASDPGQAFLLWTIDAYGEDDYLEYWNDLAANDVRILKDWTESYYGAYMEEERPMVVSYSTDQVFAAAEGYDMSRHQIAFPEGQGYANPEGVGVFDRASNAALAHTFVDFLFSSDAQAEIAQRNVQFPAVAPEHVDLADDFDQYAHEPPEAVTIGYDRLRGNLDGWVEEWARDRTGL
ncbi:ThiB subfamily ABC transporter periplasmic binding protein [Halovivax asiaticus JCM 14624]|uniref:ThiB subfamily ABC transporter periplasmic binding protein n=1 Tax=Halovivax asiaticus JCM 14624 TaxID=1227490 RepID=M0BGU0_9EURY|nr:thiamine ABC transporter substrate-binding protein [Halovivax asiaticus]ELZ10106.1 ThiB subfamily ABC transporter periplasmic binding protein [Halovivax asiaticus JCM 14624]